MMTRLVSGRPQCPRHRARLDEGPVLYRCPEGHSVYAADIDNDFRPAPVLYSAAGFVWAIAALWASFGFLVVTR